MEETCVPYIDAQRDQVIFFIYMHKYAVTVEQSFGSEFKKTLCCGIFQCSLITALQSVIKSVFDEYGHPSGGFSTFADSVYSRMPPVPNLYK